MLVPKVDIHHRGNFYPAGTPIPDKEVSISEKKTLLAWTREVIAKNPDGSPKVDNSGNIQMEKEFIMEEQGGKAPDINRCPHCGGII